MLAEMFYAGAPTMTGLTSCSSCGGFAPATARRCPHCETSIATGSGFARKLLAVAGGGAVAVTLMACYGMPPSDRQAPEKASAETTKAVPPPSASGATSATTPTGSAAPNASGTPASSATAAPSATPK